VVEFRNTLVMDIAEVRGIMGSSLSKGSQENIPIVQVCCYFLISFSLISVSFFYFIHRSLFLFLSFFLSFCLPFLTFLSFFFFFLKTEIFGCLYL